MSRDGKGMFHASLVVLACAEGWSAQTRKRRFMCGVMAGWHLASALWHWLYEKPYPRDPR